MLSRRSRELDIGMPLPCEMLPGLAPYGSWSICIGIGIPPAARSWLVRLDFGCPDC